MNEQNLRWYLPRLEGLEEYNLRSVDREIMEVLIAEKALHPNCPILLSGAGIKKAIAFPELQPIFTKSLPDLQQAMAEAYFVNPESLEQLKLLAIKQRTLRKSSESIELDNVNLSRKKRPFITKSVDKNDPLGLVKKTSDTGAVDSMAKVWWLPDLPEFEGRQKYPQNQINLEYLIKQKILLPEHYVRFLYGVPQPAGRFELLSTFFRRLNPAFDSFVVRPKYMLKSPESGWAPEALQRKSFDSITLPLPEKMSLPSPSVSSPPGIEGQSLIVHATDLALVTLAIVMVPILLLSALTMTTNSRGILEVFMSIASLKVLAILLVSTLTAGHTCAMIFNKMGENVWDFGICAAVFAGIFLLLGGGTEAMALFISGEGWDLFFFRSGIWGLGAILTVGALIILQHSVLTPQIPCDYYVPMTVGQIIRIAVASVLLLGSAEIGRASCRERA